MREHPHKPFARALPGLLFVTPIFPLNFLSRTSPAQLLPAVEADLDHAGAGRLFLLPLFRRASRLDAGGESA